jgi:hypothetical protein
MLNGAEDCKWIFNALIDYTMVLCRMEERAPESDERQGYESLIRREAVEGMTSKILQGFE